MHELLAGFYNGELTREDMLTKFLLDFNTEVEGERPRASTVQQYICKGANYIRSFKPIDAQILGVEQEVRYKIEGIPFIGYIDIIAEDDHGIFIVDHKSKELSGRSKRKKPTASDLELDEMLKQLYLYAEAIRQKYGKYPYKLCFNSFRAGIMVEEPFNKSACESAKQWALDSIEQIKNAESFRPNLEFFACKNICGLNEDCCYYEMQGM